MHIESYLFICIVCVCFSGNALHPRYLRQGNCSESVQQIENCQRFLMPFGHNVLMTKVMLMLSSAVCFAGHNGALISHCRHCIQM